MEDLNKKIVSGVFWTSIQFGINKSFGFIVKIILARMLYPEDFGLVGIAVVFTSFIQVFNDLGFGAALIQKKKESLREEHFHTAFWTGIIWSIVIYLIIYFFISKAAAIFYEKPILEVLIPVLSLSVLSSPVNVVHIAQLTKAMNFKKLAVINNISSIASGVLSIILALLGAGVWSLVFNSVAGFLITMPLLFKATHWVPKLLFSKAAFQEIFGFGVYTTGTRVFYNLIDKLDYLLIGKFLSATSLGVYTLAYLLTDTFRSQIMMITNKVMFPAYSKIQEDKTLVKKYYQEVVKINCILIYPVMIAFLIVGEDLVLTIFGQKWEGSTLALKILSVAVMVHLLVNSWGSVLRGLGHPALEFKIQLFRGIAIYSPIMFAGIYFYGIVGAATAFLINKIIMFFIAQYFLNKIIFLKFSELLHFLRLPLILSITCIIAGYFLKYLNVHFLIIFFVIQSGYFTIIYFFMKDDLSKIKNLAKQKTLNKL